MQDTQAGNAGELAQICRRKVEAERQRGNSDEQIMGSNWNALHLKLGSNPSACLRQPFLKRRHGPITSILVDKSASPCAN